MKSFRRWLSKLLFGFDVVEYAQANANLTDKISSAVAMLLEEREYMNEFVKVTTRVAKGQQDSIVEMQKTFGHVLQTLNIHQDALKKITSEFDSLPTVKIKNLN